MRSNEAIPVLNPVKFRFDDHELLNLPCMQKVLEHVLKETKSEEFSHA